MFCLVNEDLPILDVLSRLSPQSSKTSLRSWLKEGRVTVDGELIKRADSPVKKGQQVKVSSKSAYAREGVRILYEDSHLVVIDKPEGLLSVASAFETGETAHAILKDKYRPRKVYVVHRLDRETSGLMLFALSEEARDNLKKAFEKHEIQRLYCAIVEGKIPLSKGIWSSYLWEDPSYVVNSSQNPEKGQLAITHYEVKSSSKRFTSLEVKLETGRKNQIRVHCNDAGHPVSGDKKYGGHSSPIKRLCLHAHTLTFKHPISGKAMTFNSPPPNDFKKLITPMRKSRDA